MKKFLGGLLAAIGLGCFCGGFYLCMEYGYYYINDHGFYRGLLEQAVIYGLLALAGLVALWKGRGLYRAEGEGSTAKKVSGVLVTIAGIFLAVFGCGLTQTYYYGFELVPAGLYIVLGIILAVTGSKKFRAERSVTVQKATAAVEPDPQAAAPETPPSAIPETPPAAPPKEPKGMVCPDCGKKYPLDQVYCDECGALLKEAP